MHGNVQPPDMERLGRYARMPYGTALIWCGFGLLTILATKPVWSRLLFGYEPTTYELLSLRCFGL
jgi:hypothetical protein